MKTILTMALSLLLIANAVYGGSAAPAIRVSGASTIQPLAEKIAELYTRKYRRIASVQGGGSQAGIDDVRSHTSDIGMVSRVLKKEEKSWLNFTTFGFDAVVFIVNISNPLSRINKGTVVELFRGDIKSWKKLNGQDEAVLLVSKQPGRSTLELFEDYSGLKHPVGRKKGVNGLISMDALEIGSNLESATLVGGVPGAIGYVSVGTANSLISQGMPVKILTLDGVPATKENILNKSYPISRELNLVRPEWDQKSREYIDLFLGDEGRKLIINMGFVPNLKSEITK